MIDTFSGIIALTFASCVFFLCCCYLVYQFFEKSVSKLDHACTSVQQLVHSTTVDVQDTVKAVVTDATDTVFAKIYDVNQLLGEEELSWASLATNAGKHKVGLSAAVYTISQAKNLVDLTNSGILFASLLGVESSALNSILRRGFGTLPTRQVQAGMEDLIKTSWDRKRLMGLAGLSASVLGINLDNSDYLAPLKSAAASQRALEDTWDKIEEYLNSIGVISSGKYAYLKDLTTQASLFSQKLEEYNVVMATQPAQFIRPDKFREWVAFKREFNSWHDILVKNTCPDMRNMAIFAEANILKHKILDWDSKIANYKQTCGTRPCPVGVCLVGESQIGKSTLYLELTKRVSAKLEAKAAQNPALASFLGASNWQTWSVQVRDEYDQGYGGQEYTYCDDGFSGKDNMDHQQWLTFISGQSVGTVQASLVEKGMPYLSRMVTVSCNFLPSSSVTIHNIEALHNRFPVTIAARLKVGAAGPVPAPTPNTPYDPDFKHLEFHVAPMMEHCYRSNGSNCGFKNNQQGSCGASSASLQDIVDLVVDRIIAAENKFLTQIASLNTQVVQSDVDDDFAALLAQAELIIPDLNEDSEIESVQTFSSFSTSSSDSMSVSTDVSSAYSLRDAAFVLHSPGEDSAMPYTPASGPQDLWRMECIGEIRAAFRSQPIISVDDARVYSWASLLRTRDGLTFEEWCALTNTRDASSFFLSLGAFVVPDENFRDFRKKFLTSFRHIARIHDLNLDTCYLYGMPLNFCKELVAAPFLETVGWSDPALVSYLADIQTSRIEPENALMREQVEDMIVFHLDASSTSFFRGTIYLSLGYLSGFLGLKTITGIFAVASAGALWLSLVITSQAIRTYISPGPLLGRFPILRDGFLHQIIDVGAWIVRCRDNILAEAILRINSIVEYISSAFGWVMLKIGSIFNISFSRLIPDFATTEARAFVKSLMTGTGLILVGVAAGFIYGIVKYLLRKDNPRDEQSSHKARPISKQKKTYSKVRPLQRKVQCQSGLLTRLVDRPNLYDDDTLQCPFCDEDTIYADGDVYDLGNFLAKPNKYTPAEHNYVIFCKSHAVQSPLDGSLERELNAAVQLVQELELPSAFIERNFGRCGGGSVPHNHIKIYDHIGCNISGLPGKFISEITSIKDEGNVVIRITFSCKLEDVDTLFSTYDLSNFGSFGLGVDYSDGYLQGTLLLPTTLREGVEVPLDKLLAGKILSQYNPELKLAVQSADDNALATLKSMCEHSLVKVVAPGAKGFIDFETFTGISLTGIAIGTHVVCPAHICAVGTLVRLYHVGVNATKDVNYIPHEYCVGIMRVCCEVGDLGLIEILSVREAQTLTGQKLSSAVNRQYSLNPLNHLMREADALKYLTRASVIQWLPTAGAIATGKASWCGTRVISLKGVDGQYRRVERELIDVVCAETDISLTKTGDCGGPLFIFDAKASKKWIGIHVSANDRVSSSALLTIERYEELVSLSAHRELQARDEQWRFKVKDPHPPLDVSKGGMGSLQVENWPATDWAKVDSFKAFTSGSSMADLPYGEDLAYVGGLTYLNSAAPLRAASTWERSPFFGIFAEELIPTAFSPYDERIVSPVPLNRAGEPSLLVTPMSEQANVLPIPDIALFEFCVDSFVDYYSVLFAGEKLGLHTLTCAEALQVGMNGPFSARFMTGMEVKTSPGVPWTSNSQVKHKSDLIAVDEKTGLRSFHDTSLGKFASDVCTHKLQRALVGERTTSFCTSKLKNCLVKVSQVEIGKTRVFNCSALETVVVSNTLFGPFKEVYLSRGIEASHGVGMDALSYDWEHLFLHLSRHPNLVDADFANFDKKISSLFLRAAFWIIIAVIDRVDPDSFSRARFVAADELVNSFIVDNRTIYMTEHGNKSGDAMTTIINNIVNCLYGFYAFCEATDTRDFSYYTENVRQVVFGDDRIESVSDLVADQYNFVSFRRSMETLGQVVTPGSKDADPNSPFVTFSNVTFLRRGFATMRGHSVGPLIRRSIQGVFNWSEVPAVNTDVWYQIVESHLEEASLHGVDYYNEFSGKLFSRVRSVRFPLALRVRLAPLASLTYGVWEDRYFSFRFKTLSLEAAPPADDTIQNILYARDVDLYTWLTTEDIPNVNLSLANLQQQLNALGKNIGTVQKDLGTLQGLFTTFELNTNKRLDALEAGGSSGLAPRVQLLEDQVDSIIQVTSSLVEQSTTTKTRVQSLELVNKYGLGFTEGLYAIRELRSSNQQFIARGDWRLSDCLREGGGIDDSFDSHNLTLVAYEVLYWNRPGFYMKVENAADETVTRFFRIEVVYRSPGNNIYEDVGFSIDGSTNYQTLVTSGDRFYFFYILNNILAGKSGNTDI